MELTKDIIHKYDVPGPRYTSYPTAPVWSDDVTADVYLQKLADFGRSDKTLSLYVHIPFCQTMCSFCACNVVIRKHDDKYGDEYLKYLFKEIDMVAAAIGQRKLIKQLHWGGGTPTFLSIPQMRSLYQKIADLFEIAPDAEVAIEIDPRRTGSEKIQALREMGFNRISLGVQDFDDRVQQSVNRIQPFDMVEEVSDQCRELRFDSLNFDLIYGLPYQTGKTFDQTIDKVLQLKPDRIALYSFAYLPWMKKHQTKIEDEALPDNDEKIDIFLNSRAKFLANGYQAIAMDHFALKNDELARAYEGNRLYRNFMGYTVKPADEYIGVGVSSIGFLQETFVQNHKILPKYYEILEAGQLPIERGKVLSEDDRIRQWTITSLMCHFSLEYQTFEQKFDHNFSTYFIEEQSHIQQCIEDGLLEESAQGLKVTELGRLFIRNICMGFDWYLRQKGSHQRFSRTV